MSFAMGSLLAHNEHVPPAARAALRAAHDGPPERRLAWLESAARILRREAGMECIDARELVGLDSGECAG